MIKILNKPEIEEEFFHNVKRFLLTGIYCIGAQIALFGLGASLTALV